MDTHTSSSRDFPGNKTAKCSRTTLTCLNATQRSARTARDGSSRLQAALLLHEAESVIPEDSQYVTFGFCLNKVGVNRSCEASEAAINTPAIQKSHYTALKSGVILKVRPESSS